MNDEQQERFENELRRVRPAQPPADLMARLTEARLAALARQRMEVSTPGLLETWMRWLRWLAPATAIVIVAAGLVWRWNVSTDRAPKTDLVQQTAAPPAIKADAVQIGHELVSTFDAVARLPGGDPVRFRCREWVEDGVFRDSVQGVVIEQRTPRMEVVPVRFETY